MNDEELLSILKNDLLKRTENSLVTFKNECKNGDVTYMSNISGGVCNVPRRNLVDCTSSFDMLYSRLHSLETVLKSCKNKKTSECQHTIMLYNEISKVLGK